MEADTRRTRWLQRAFLIFILGVGCGLTAARLSLWPAVPLDEARRRAIAVLDRHPVIRDTGPNRIVEAVRRIEPAVVNIDTVGQRRTPESEPDFWPGSREVRGKGSGVILTSDGYVVTNRHVVEDADRIRVTLANGQWYYARKVGSDPVHDLAVLRIPATNLPVAELGDSDRLQVGEWTIAVGNPLGLGSTITVGVISALNRRNLQLDEHHSLDGMIQTDAAINRGNSGGALANAAGQVIGINTAILSAGPSGGSIGLGFAIPSNTVRRVVREIILTGKSSSRPPAQPWLGIEFGPVPDPMARQLGLPDGQGVLVRRTLDNSPAARAGLRSGDILIAIDGKEIGDLRDVREAVLQRKVGEEALVTVLRTTSRRSMEFRIRVAEKPEQISLTTLP
ncbi:MAG: trypsin-like peptidase domain-containing protein [Chloroherpetonaceae bacterium]|nr:trypsin-like peptidase domain-containing protein [Chthonomonadaceae bacterium]MDW8207090.1 trypsin-like peptidase domain-containing protein [Chloroherpetonaceae bacterium]